MLPSLRSQEPQGLLAFSGGTKAGSISRGLPKHRAGPGCSYPKSDLPVSTHLQIEAVWAIPVAINDVYFAVTVEICQGHTSAMLMRVVYAWGGEEGASGCYRLHVP